MEPVDASKSNPFNLDAYIAQQRREFCRQFHDRHRMRRALGHGLGADVDHRGLTLGIQVGEHDG